MRARDNSREKWVATTREGVHKALAEETSTCRREGCRGGAPALMGTRSSVRSPARSPKSALRSTTSLSRAGHAFVPEEERMQYDPPGSFVLACR